MAYPDEETPLLLLLVLATRHLVDALQEHLVAAGFADHRVVHHNVMAHVTYEGTRLTELAEKAGVTKQAMSELVADLERRGYLRREPDPADGRAKLVRFTDRGRRAVDAAMRAFDRIEGGLAEHMGAELLGAVRRGLLEVIAADLPGPPPRRRGRSQA